MNILKRKVSLAHPLTIYFGYLFILNFGLLECILLSARLSILGVSVTRDRVSVKNKLFVCLLAKWNVFQFVFFFGNLLEIGSHKKFICFWNINEFCTLFVCIPYLNAIKRIDFRQLWLVRGMWNWTIQRCVSQ